LIRVKQKSGTHAKPIFNACPAALRELRGATLENLLARSLCRTDRTTVAGINIGTTGEAKGIRYVD